MVIDCHTHIFPDKLAERAVKSLENSGNIQACLNGTLKDLKRSMKMSGVDYSVTLPIATKPMQCESINNSAFELNKDENIIAFGTIHPLYESWEGELERIKSNGLKGIKLHPDFQNMYIDDENMLKVMEKATELGLVVTVHCGKDISFETVHCTPKRIAESIRNIKNKKIIIAHMGGYRYLDEAEEYIIGSEVYIDVSFVLGRCDKKQICRMIKGHDPDRILFGTDSPWTSQSESIKILKELDISDGLKEKILHLNAEKLFDMKV